MNELVETFSRLNINNISIHGILQLFLNLLGLLLYL